MPATGIMFRRRRSAAALAVALFGALCGAASTAHAQDAQAGCPMSFMGVIDGTDAKQVGRLSRINTSVACGATKPSPGIGFPTGAFSYDLYRFTNPGTTDECVMIQT